MMETLKNMRAWNNVELSTQLEHGDDMFEEWFPRAAFKHPFARGGLAYALYATLIRASHLTTSPFLVPACYADQHDMVADVALRLSQFRGEKGRDAESLAEVGEALGWKPREDADLEVFYEPIPAPEGAAEGTFAYAIGLKPKASCRKAFENTGAAWLVIRNPNFGGTLSRRFLTLAQYGQKNGIDTLWDWDLRVGDEDCEIFAFILPPAFFGDDPTALEKAVKAMKARWWTL